MRMSMAMPSAVARSCKRCGANGSARSSGQTCALMPCCETSFASASSRSTRRAVNTRSCPSAAISRASAAPMPAEAPVMRAVPLPRFDKSPLLRRLGFGCRSSAHIVVEEGGAVAVLPPQDGKEALVHLRVADAFIAVVDVADLGRMELRRRRHAVGDGGAARPIGAIPVGAVPGAAVMEGAAAGRHFDGHDLRLEADLGRGIQQFLPVVIGRM